jgi:glutamate--glyoxylate aminotransferase
VPYLLDEGNGWALKISELKRAVDEARREGKHVRGLVFINPGNPTGQCLSQDNLRELIKFAHKEHIVLMADEVYQENIYQVCLTGSHLSQSACLLVKMAAQPLEQQE